MLESILIYDAPDAIGLNIGVVAQYLSDLLPSVGVEARTDFFTYHLGQFDLPQVEVLTEEVAARLREREVHNLVGPARRDDLPPERPEDRELGTVYRAEPLQEVMRTLLPQDQRGGEHLHIVHIAQCIGHWAAGASRFRLQIIQHGQPSIISTTGFVEVPALPREYAFRRAYLLGFGMEEAAAELDERFAHRALAHGDERITQVATGFALQALFKRLFDEEGCEDPTCPLHPAATHDELAAAHLGEESGLCERHLKMLIEARRDSE
ncbi:MAG: DUF6775 family putative metallopeptidase [Armatimonadota bacterium]|nr:DUF6775 family putative metallopeptidase [Armatimonadota bacterium]